DAVEELSGTIEKNNQSVLEYKAKVDDLEKEIKALKAKGGRMAVPSSSVRPTLKDAIFESILEQKAAIQKMAKSVRPENNFEFEVKAVADMTFGVNFSSANVSTATLRPGIIAAPPRPMHIRSLLNGGGMSGSHYVYIKETGHDSDPAAVLEAGNKAQMD